MKLSLYVKFIISYILFGILSFLLITIFTSKINYNNLLKKTSSILYDEATIISSSFNSEFLENDNSQINFIAKSLKSSIWIVNKDAKIIFDTSKKYTNQFIKDFNPIIFANKTYITGNFFSMFLDENISVLSPIIRGYTTHAYVLIHLPLNKLKEENNKVLNIFYLSFLIIFIFSLLIIITFHFTIYRPLKKINLLAKQYASGNLSYKININSNDEMGQLYGTLNLMARELSKAEEYQKTFITNISHDFRSPLTSIKGFLEAILDNTIPHELQNKYIEKVLNETKRLTKLTNSILTLNQSDFKAYLFRTNFNINKVIKEIAESFEIQCLEKNINFELVFYDEAIVNADLGKIQQVLYNLIDNAIKFSYQDSTITITTYPKYEKLFISIKDTGLGIPLDNISKIFDRFYKTDISRGKDKKGLGLGLFIVKEIILAHKESIDVISTEKIGTEFIFSLRLVKK